MRHFEHVLLAVGLGAILALAGLAGCATRNTSSGNRTPAQVTQDATVNEEVQAALAAQPQYYGNVKTKTLNQMVRLSGTVQTEAEKQKAAELAQQVPGVRGVNNEITVLPQPGPFPTGSPTGFPNGGIEPPPKIRPY